MQIDYKLGSSVTRPQFVTDENNNLRTWGILLLSDLDFHMDDIPGDQQVQKLNLYLNYHPY